VTGDIGTENDNTIFGQCRIFAFIIFLLFIDLAGLDLLTIQALLME
jgi:hypothetical protein